MTALAQAASQRNWNDARVSRLLAAGRRGFDFFTAGASGRSPEDLLRVMASDGFRAKILVDIRAHPFSRHIPHWNRTPLERVVRAAGLEYLSRPELGVPSDLRGRLHERELGYGEIFRWYDAHVATPATVRSLGPVLAAQPVFLCTELGPEFCHRHRLAMAIEGASGMVSLDL